ncbi:MAG: tyrosine-type recombinase/integrase [Nitrospiraceae bacterium]
MKSRPFSANDKCDKPIAIEPGNRGPCQSTHHPRTPLFANVNAEDLQALLARDTTADPLTFRELSRLYAVHHLRARPARREFERIFRQFWQPWVDRRADALTKKEVRIWYMGLAHIPGHANKAAALLRALYNWADRMELVTGSNPVLHLLRYRQSSRERFLSVEEVQHFLAGLPHLPLKPRAYLLLLLLTGARLSEALAMRWQDVEWTSRIWRKPHTKNGTSHHAPLPVQVVEVLQQLPRISEWVFPGARTRQHWSAASAEKMWLLTRRRWNLHDVRLHDLRRTCASFLAIAGENLPTIQNVLNHKSLAPTSIYARLNTKAVDRALQRQADRLMALQEAPDHDVWALEHVNEQGVANTLAHAPRN